MIELPPGARARFDEDGFVAVLGALSPDELGAARDRFERMFRGEFETGLYPDEWNWREGRDRADLTRQICNGWRSDYTIARVVLREDIARAGATLMGWDGVRLCQDNVLWKPPGAKPLGFHQDDSYQTWTVPGEMVTCWLALDDTTADGGTIEYVRGSHRWGLAAPIREFHAPEVYDAEMQAGAKRAGVSPDIVRIEAAAGDAVFHHGRLWHGSGHNRTDRHRRSLAVHCIPAQACFHPTNVGYIYGRYKRSGDCEMDESFFPVLWTRDGRRSAFLEPYLA